MDGQSKLKRTPSSLLRSSTTIRSSIHSLSSVNEITPEQEQDVEEQKPHKPGPVPVRPGPSRLLPVLVLSLLSLYTLFAYFREDETPTSESILLALIFVAVSLFFAGKHRDLLRRVFEISKQFCNEYYTKKFWFPKKKSKSKSVQWFIGEPIQDRKEKKIVREGVEVYNNGNVYEGEFHKGRCNGSGVFRYFANGRYEGDWIDGKYDGYGIESWARGSKYHGQYKQGLRHGYGVYRFCTGDSFSGEWFNGQSHGVGVQSCSDGSCYIGEFKRGVKHGLGCYHFRNGDRYAGEYFGDKMHGFGIYDFRNGHCYEGSWHEGQKQGYGMYTFRNSEPQYGVWDCGNLKTALPPLTDAVLRVVQDARKRAENAFNLPQVDEQVDKAVAAANRAATAARVAAVKAIQNRMDGKLCYTDV